MNSIALCHRRTVWTRMAGYTGRAVAVVVLAATVGVSAVAAQVTSPTGATLPIGVPVFVQWTPSSFAGAPKVDIYLSQVLPTWQSLGILDSAVNRFTGHATVNLPASLICTPASTFAISVVGYVDPFDAYTIDSPNFHLACGGSITVVKTAVDESGASIQSGTFTVDVACGPNGPNTSVALNSANSFQGTVRNIVLGRTCLITERAPRAAVGCRWKTTYPQGQGVDVGNAADYRREVHNQLSCIGDGPLTAGRGMGRGAGIAATGLITVTKRIVNKTSVPIPDGSYQVKVDCTPGGPHQGVTLTSPSGLQQTVEVPAGSACTITEMPAVAPRPCQWQTTYPNGRQGGVGSALVVQNELMCGREETGDELFSLNARTGDHVFVPIPK
jgi:hypothetical protein